MIYLIQTKTTEQNDRTSNPLHKNKKNRMLRDTSKDDDRQCARISPHTLVDGVLFLPFKIIWIESNQNGLQTRLSTKLVKLKSKIDKALMRLFQPGASSAQNLRRRRLTLASAHTMAPVETDCACPRVTPSAVVELYNLWLVAIVCVLDTWNSRVLCFRIVFAGSHFPVLCCCESDQFYIPNIRLQWQRFSSFVLLIWLFHSKFTLGSSAEQS